MRCCSLIGGNGINISFTFAILTPPIMPVLFRLNSSKNEGGNLAASNIRNLECPSYEVYLIDYGCGKFNKKVHIME